MPSSRHTAMGLASINRSPCHSPCEVVPSRMAKPDAPPAEPGLLHRHKSCRRRGRGRWVPWGTPWPATPPQGSSLHARRRPRSTPAQPGPPAAPYVLPSSRQTAMGLAGINRSPCHSPCEVVLHGWRSLMPPRPGRVTCTAIRPAVATAHQMSQQGGACQLRSLILAGTAALRRLIISSQRTQIAPAKL